MCCKREILVPPKLGGLDRPGLSVQPQEAHHRADTHTALLRSLRNGSSPLDRFNHTCPQILRIRLRHPCWPPLPSTKLESYSRAQGNPDSAFPENALNHQDSVSTPPPLGLQLKRVFEESYPRCSASYQ